jgi:hypothetical protein
MKKFISGLLMIVSIVIFLIAFLSHPQNIIQQIYVVSNYILAVGTLMLANQLSK